MKTIEIIHDKLAMLLTNIAHAAVERRRAQVELVAHPETDHLRWDTACDNLRDLIDEYIVNIAFFETH